MRRDISIGLSAFSVSFPVLVLTWSIPVVGIGRIVCLSSFLNGFQIDLGIVWNPSSTVDLGEKGYGSYTGFFDS